MSRPRRLHRLTVGYARGVAVALLLALAAGVLLLPSTGRPAPGAGPGLGLAGESRTPSISERASSGAPVSLGARLTAEGKAELMGAQAADAADGTMQAAALGASESAPRLMVKLLSEYPGGLDPAVLSRLGLHQVQAIPQLDLVVLQTDGAGGSAGLERAVADVQALPGVRRVEVEGTRTALLAPDDPWFPEQWALPRVDLPGAWDVSIGAGEVVIAILDTGLARDIPDLQDRIYQPYSVVYDSSEWPAWEDVEGHGSAVAAVAAAQGNNGEGMAGAAWNVKVMPIHLSDTKNYSESLEIKGIVWATDHGADVINISAGSPHGSDAEHEAVDYALGRGVVVVAAAGNQGGGVGVQYPAAYPGVIAVGASARPAEPDLGRQADRRASFSNDGAELDLLAPGEDIISYYADETHFGEARWDGTSFASPLVAGVAALMLSVNPGLSPEQVEQALTGTAVDLGVPGRDDDTGSGLLDARAAVARAAGLPTTTTTTGPEPGFADVPPSHPYAAQIAELVHAGVIDGYGDGTFRPDAPVSRQQFTKMILLALGQTPTQLMVSPFLDVDLSASGLYPDHFIAMAYHLGVVKGTSVLPPLFSPYKSIARAQAITMVVRGADALHPGRILPAPIGYRPPFGSFSPEHDPSAARASYNGMLDDLAGMGPGWDVWQSASRGEVAVILAHLLPRQ